MQSEANEQPEVEVVDPEGPGILPEEAYEVLEDGDYYNTPENQFLQLSDDSQ